MLPDASVRCAGLVRARPGRPLRSQSRAKGTHSRGLLASPVIFVPNAIGTGIISTRSATSAHPGSTPAVRCRARDRGCLPPAWVPSGEDGNDVVLGAAGTDSTLRAAKGAEVVPSSNCKAAYPTVAARKIEDADILDSRQDSISANLSFSARVAGLLRVDIM